MSRIDRIEVTCVNLTPEVVRTDAIQTFTRQETPLVTIRSDDGACGTGYSYTIGTGGSSVVRLIHDHLAPLLIGCDPEPVEAIWKRLLFATHATAVGAVTSLALAAIDTALWDLRCRRAGLPLRMMAGGARDRVPLYTTEGGWLHLDAGALVDDALAARERGFVGSKIKVGRPHVSEDVRRLTAVRDAVGPDFDIMVDANQAFEVGEAVRRARHFVELDIAWLEEPLPADDVAGHRQLARSTTLPIAVGESLYSLGQIREYLEARACAVVQADVARIGGITPWLKAAHLAEAFNLPICPHFLMELHVSLAAAVPNGRLVEYIPQLDPITIEPMRVENGHAVASEAPGLGIAWDAAAIQARRTPEATLVIQ